MADFNVKNLENIAVKNFRKYLQIPSVHPDVNYEGCVSFLKEVAEDIALPVEIYRVFPEKPVVVITLYGTELNLPSIILNSHMDVVPVFENEWSYNPFGAEVDAKGNIYGRGAQDMKSVGIQYLEAIRKLKKDGTLLRRTVHVVFVPDEEIGGSCGMDVFTKNECFKGLNAGFALDEALSSDEDYFYLYYGERTTWSLRIHCEGESGHGSMLLDNTAGEKMERFLEKLFEFRQQEKGKLNDPSVLLGDVTTVNVTKIEGGEQVNVVPRKFIITIDCRLPTTVNLNDWENTLKQWCKEAGENVWIEFTQKSHHIADTDLDNSNLFWLAFKSATDEMGLDVKPEVCIGATDARFLRQLGIPAIGFSPINNTPKLVHRENEHLNIDVFLKGVDIYYKIIEACANS